MNNREDNRMSKSRKPRKMRSTKYNLCYLPLVHPSPSVFGRGTAVTMKNMLESQFPGINVVLANYPPPLPKRLLSKLVPVLQFGVIGVIMGGEHIFPRLGYASPPQWYYSMRANRFGSMASTWLLGNFFQSFLQNSGAFEVYCNGELVMFLLSFVIYQY